VFCLISSYEMQEIHEDNDEERKREETLSRIQFWEGVAETIFGIGMIGFDVFGVALGATVCGILELGEL
jgi:hypothetical protein